MHPSAPDVARGRLRRLGPVLLLLAVPKCLLCLLAYTGLGAALGLAGPELCGAGPEPAAVWTGWLLPLGAGAGLAGWLIVLRGSNSVPSGPDAAGRDR